MFQKLGALYKVVKLDIVTHLSGIVLGAGFLAQHGDTLGRVLHNVSLGSTIADWCILLGILGLYVNGITPASNALNSALGTNK